jgi:hypothetical protein
MPKKRKTKKEKLQKDHKRQVVHQAQPSVISSEQLGKHTDQQIPTQGMTFSIPTSNTEVQSAPRKTKPTQTTTVISTEEYGYLGVDLLKTAIVTCAVVITEVIIRILFRG